MTKQHAQASFSVKKWEEAPYLELDGGVKFSQAHVENIYQGDIEGESTLEYLLYYNGDGSYSFVGLEHITGRLDGRSGSFVIQHQGTDENGATKSTCFVVPGSATGELKGLRGEGGFLLDGQAERYPIVLEFELNENARVD
jgi:hypothetical protein